MTREEQNVIDYMGMREEVIEKLNILRDSIKSNAVLLTTQLTEIEYSLDALSYTEIYYQELKQKEREEILNKRNK